VLIRLLNTKEIPMPYVYSKVDSLEGEDKVGTQQCAVLIQRYTNAGPAHGWRQGEAVFGNPMVKKGTAIRWQF
jgi:hypothetical protein